MSVEKEYVYSTDQEIYYTKEAFKEHLKILGIGDFSIIRAIKVSYTHDEFVWVDKFLEIMEELAEETCNYENPLYTNYTQQEKDGLHKVIVDWLVKNKGQPKIFGVEDVPEDMETE